MVDNKLLRQLSAGDFKDFFVCSIHSDDNDYSISHVAKMIGVDPSTMNRYVNSDNSHLPAYLIPMLPDELRSAVLHYLDNQSGNPIKGGIDTSDLNGSIRDESDGIVEALGEIIRLERTKPGSRSKHEKIKIFQRIGLMAQRAEQELNSRD